MIWWLAAVLALSACGDPAVLTQVETPDSGPNLVPPITHAPPDSGPAASPEVCDRIDNDLDGVVDQLWGDVCYSGPPEAVLHPPCRAGVRFCDRGVWSCEGERLPGPEVCDQTDNDCNGIADDAPGGALPEDVVLAVDLSCSMIDRIESVRTALLGARSSLLTPARNVWLLRLPTGDAALYAPADPCPCGGPAPPCGAPMEEAIRGLRTGAAGFEATLDLMLDLATGAAPLELREGVPRTLVLFGDEPPQTNRSPQTTVAEIRARWPGGLRVVVWMVPDASPGYEAIGGDGRDLSVRPISQLSARSLLESLPPRTCGG